jgi:hypothetical protein
MSYGTGPNGGQGAASVYDMWYPAMGTGTTAHAVLPNTTSTDIFCSGLSVMTASGEVLIVGRDQTINGQRNYSSDRATIFHPQTNTIDGRAHGLSAVVSHHRCAAHRGDAGRRRP